MSYQLYLFCDVFFFNDTATTEIYTLSLHDALPILGGYVALLIVLLYLPIAILILFSLNANTVLAFPLDRKSTRLNSSHANISYAVFCLKKKKTNITKFQISPSTHLIEPY